VFHESWNIKTYSVICGPGALSPPSMLARLGGIVYYTCHAFMNDNDVWRLRLCVSVCVCACLFILINIACICTKSATEGGAGWRSYYAGYYSWDVFCINNNTRRTCIVLGYYMSITSWQYNNMIVKTMFTIVISQVTLKIYLCVQSGNISFNSNSSLAK